MKTFNDQFIAVKTKFETWEEAIAFSGQLLLDKGKITQSYIEAMIDNINKLGPYILIAPNIALPHARPENGVNEEGISIVVLKEPIFIGDDSEKQAKILICLAAKDSNSHLSLLKTISSWLSDNELMEQMLAVETKEELDQILKTYYL